MPTQSPSSRPGVGLSPSSASSAGRCQDAREPPPSSYPGGGNFTATPARIREAIKLSGPDIYRDPTPVTRDVYTIRAEVDQGNSGGPLIDLNGHVLGVVYGAAVDDADTGFALTASEVASQLSSVGNTQAVGTGACIN
jgi:S1-C subfamily serine protease